MSRERERQIRAWLIRHYDDADPPRIATHYIAELLNALVTLRLAAPEAQP
jgi:hypothetical protein